MSGSDSIRANMCIQKWSPQQILVPVGDILEGLKMTNFAGQKMLTQKKRHRLDITGYWMVSRWPFFSQNFSASYPVISGHRPATAALGASPTWDHPKNPFRVSDIRRWSKWSPKNVLPMIIYSDYSVYSLSLLSINLSIETTYDHTYDLFKVMQILQQRFVLGVHGSGSVHVTLLPGTFRLRLRRELRRYGESTIDRSIFSSKTRLLNFHIKSTLDRYESPTVSGRSAPGGLRPRSKHVVDVSEQTWDKAEQVSIGT